jgi:hypothetical protein
MEFVSPLFTGGFLRRKQCRRCPGNRKGGGSGYSGPGKRRIRLHRPRGERYHRRDQGNRGSARQQPKLERGFKAQPA